MRRIMTDPSYRKAIVDHNFRVGKNDFGFEVLKNGLEAIIEDYTDEIKASRRRLAKSLTSYFV